MKILVAQTIFLGDLILTLPLVQKLKESFPDVEVDMLVNARYANVLLNNPLIARIVPFDKEKEHRGIVRLRRIVNVLRSRRYDAAIVLPGSLRTAIAVFLAGIPRRIGSDQSTGMLMWKDRVKFSKELRRSFSGRAAYWLESAWKLFGGKYSFVSSLFTDVVPLNRDLHAIERYCQLLRPLGVKEGGAEIPKLFPSNEDIKVVSALLGQVGGDHLKVGIAPGSVWQTKRWHEESFARMIKLIHERIKNAVFVMVGGSEDREICVAIQLLCGLKNVIDTSGQLSPLQSAELLRRCSVLVTNDSAAMHLAAAVGTCCVAIFGPTVPEFGFRPYGEGHIIMERNGLWCRPCTPHGGHRCPIGTHECMTSISADMVANAVSSVLGKEKS